MAWTHYEQKEHYFSQISNRIELIWIETFGKAWEKRDK